MQNKAKPGDILECAGFGICECILVYPDGWICIVYDHPDNKLGIGPEKYLATAIKQNHPYRIIGRRERTF